MPEALSETIEVEEAAGDDSGEVASLRSEVDEAIESAAARRKAEKEPAADEPVVEEPAEASPADEPAAQADDDEGEPAKPELSDEVIERAVKCGIPLNEAKQYPSEALLASMCSRIEGPGEDAGSQEGAGSQATGVDPGSVDDLLNAIPDLDPDDYDSQIVAGFKSLKEIIRQQHAEIEGLRGGQSQDWFEGKLEGVKNFTKGSAEKKAAVREKFDVLSAGYKAAGKDVTDEAVFEEAAQLVLGGDMNAARLEKKKNAAKKRNGQLLSRAASNLVESPAGDAKARVAEEIDRKYFPRR